MKSARAFTFTELLIVVAVLAIFAAAAVPRFFTINRETRLRAVEALSVHVQSSARLINRVWASSGSPAQLSVDGVLLNMRHGYPSEQSIGAIVVAGGDFHFADGYWRHRKSSASPGCAVLYIPPPNPDAIPTVMTYTDGC